MKTLEEMKETLLKHPLVDNTVIEKADIDLIESLYDNYIGETSNDCFEE